jgi:hypothetical protein
LHYSGRFEMSEPNSGILDYLTFVRTTLNRIRESDTGFVDSATMRLASQQMQHLCAHLPEILSHFSPEDFLGQWPPEFQRYDKRSFEIWLDSLQRKLELRLGLHSEGHATISEAVLLVHGIRDFAEWQSIVSNALADLPRITIIPLKYGRFDALRFWCPLWTRRRPIKKLLWRMRDARTRSPTSKLSESLTMQININSCFAKCLQRAFFLFTDLITHVYRDFSLGVSRMGPA